MKNKFLYLALLFFVLNACVNDIGLEPPRSSQKGNTITEKKLEALNIIKDLGEGLELAKKEGKPILLIFTAYAAINSRKLESEVILGNPQIYTLIRDEFINIWLYVDEKSEKGKKWSKLQAFEFNGNHQPHIFILDPRGNIMRGN